MALTQNFASNFRHFWERKMHHLLTTLVLCLAAYTGAAQAASDAAPLAAQVVPGAASIRAAGAGGDAQPLRPAAAGDLIKTAAGAPREASAMRQVPAASSQSKAAGDGDEHRGRTGPAMLLAVLAVMSAIALRRVGAADR